MHGKFYPNSNTQRLYTIRKEGGLVRINAIVLNERNPKHSGMAPKDENEATISIGKRPSRN